MSECGIGYDDLDQVLVEQRDIGGEPDNAAARQTLQHRIFQQSGGIFGGDFLVAEMAAEGDDLGQLFDRRRVPLRRTRRHDGDEGRDHARIEPIVLRQNPAGLGKLPQLERVDLAYGHAGRQQGTQDTTLVATARPRGRSSRSRSRAAARPVRPSRPCHYVPTSIAARAAPQHPTDPSTHRYRKREHCHLRIPSLLMRARARATVRVWKKRLELQAHSRFAIRGGCGLPVATGAEP